MRTFLKNQINVFCPENINRKFLIIESEPQSNSEVSMNLRGVRMLAKIPITDNHMHIDPRARGLEAVKDFKNSGGTHIILVTKPSWSLGVIVKKPEDYPGFLTITPRDQLGLV